MNNNNKFTATLVTEETKQLVVALRNESKLSEKELMTLVVKIALEHRTDILDEAASIVYAKEQERTIRNKEAYELRKVAMQEMRNALRAAKGKPIKQTNHFEVALTSNELVTA